MALHRVVVAAPGAASPALAEHLERVGFTVVATVEPAAAAELLARTPPDVLVLDPLAPPATLEARAWHLGVPVLAVVAEHASLERTLALLVAGVVVLPCSDGQLTASVQAAARTRAGSAPAVQLEALARAAAEAERRHRLHSSIQQHIPAAVALLDRDFAVRMINPVYGTFIRIHVPHPPEQLVGMSHGDLVPGSRAQLEPLFTRVRDTGRAESFTDFPLTLDGPHSVTTWDGRFAPRGGGRRCRGGRAHPAAARRAGAAREPARHGHLDDQPPGHGLPPPPRRGVDEGPGRAVCGRQPRRV